MTIRKVCPTWKFRSIYQQGLPSLVAANRGLQCWLGYPDHPNSCNSFVASLGGLKKESVEVSDILSDYLLKEHCWGILALVLSVKLMGVQYSTTVPSCCKENIFGECYLYPEVTAFMVAHEQAQQDVAHCDWHTSTLLYFSSCKIFAGPLCLVWYVDP